MKQIEELLNTGIYDTYKPERRMTVRELIDELGLKMNYFGILVDDKKADIDTVITPESKVVIIPRIAGGTYEMFDKYCPISKMKCRSDCVFFKTTHWDSISEKKQFVEGACYYASKDGMVIYSTQIEKKNSDITPITL